MICKCKICEQQIDGNLSNVYAHLLQHKIKVDAIHTSEKYIVFPWDTTNEIAEEKEPSYKDFVRLGKNTKVDEGEFLCPRCKVWHTYGYRCKLRIWRVKICDYCYKELKPNKRKSNSVGGTISTAFETNRRKH
jgi:hypothetical protein